MDRSPDSLHIVHWGRRTAGALCAAAAVWLTACGGGGGSIPSAAGPPVNHAPVDEDREAALAIYQSGALALSLTRDAFSFVARGAFCIPNNGSIQLHVGGSHAYKLPTGSHAFSAAFDACRIDGLTGTTLNGAISGDYSLAGEYDYGAQLSVRTLSAHNGVSGEGSLTLNSVSTGTVNSTDFAYTRTAAPVSGFKLVNATTGNALTFGSGSYSSSWNSASESGSDDFNSLEVELNGAHYVIHGSIQWGYDFDWGNYYYTSGVVQITRDGVLHASISGQASGDLLVEVLLPLERL
jgi:hypothetical protein